MFSLAVNPIMPLGRDNYLSTLEFLKGVSKSTQAVCLSGDFYSTTSWRWFVYYLRWICSSLHLQRITAVIKLQGQGKGRQGGEGESSSQTCLQWSFTQKRCMIQQAIKHSPSSDKSASVVRGKYPSIPYHHHCNRDDHFYASQLYRWGHGGWVKGLEGIVILSESWLSTL